MYASPVIRLRADAFRERAARDGLTSDGDLAARFGVNRTTVWRVLNGQIVPGERFIAAALDAFPDAQFSDLFEITRQRVSRRGAA